MPPSPVVSVACAAELPSTRAWLPMKTLREPSSAATVVVCTCALSWRSASSRESSRSFGDWPLPCERAICSLSAAIRVARLLMLLTASPSCELTPACRSSSRPCASRKRAAISSARVSTTLRAVMSVGVLATSDNEFSMSDTEAPMPLGPPAKMSSIDASWLARVLSIADTDCASVA